MKGDFVLMHIIKKEIYVQPCVSYPKQLQPLMIYIFQEFFMTLQNSNKDWCLLWVQQDKENLQLWLQLLIKSIRPNLYIFLLLRIQLNIFIRKEKVFFHKEN